MDKYELTTEEKISDVEITLKSLKREEWNLRTSLRIAKEAGLEDRVQDITDSLEKNVKMQASCEKIISELEE